MIGTGDPVSPTAHYTGYVWARNGLSPPEFQTLEGRFLFESLRPIMTVNSILGRGSLEQHLLSRHRAIDLLLERAIEQHDVSQVLELAAGMSARGWRFTTRYPQIRYIEGDLPDMVVRKRQSLQRMDGRSDQHQVVELDVLRESGPGSLDSVAVKLEPSRGLAIITEGLLGYLPTERVDGIWRHCARTLRDFAHGHYISDIHLSSLQTIEVRAFRLLLSAFVRGRVYMHFRDPGEVVDALTAAGFVRAEVWPAVAITGMAPSPGTRLAYALVAEA